MPQPTRDELAEQLRTSEEARVRAEARAVELQAELARVREWRRSTLAAVVAVALLAVLMLGIVAFNAVDDEALRATIAV